MCQVLSTVYLILSIKILLAGFLLLSNIYYFCYCFPFTCTRGKILSFPSGARGKEPACQCRRLTEVGSIPGWGRSPGGGHGNPLQYSCLENPHGQRSLAGYSPWGLKALDMTEWLTQHSMDLYRQWGGVLPVMLRNQGNLFRGDREVWIISTIFPGNNFPGPLNWCGGLYKRKHAFGIELPRWLSGKESTCQCRRHRRHRFDLWVGKIPLKEEMATRPRILAWGIPWTEEAGGLQRWSQTVG